MVVPASFPCFDVPCLPARPVHGNDLRQQHHQQPGTGSGTPAGRRPTGPVRNEVADWRQLRQQVPACAARRAPPAKSRRIQSRSQRTLAHNLRKAGTDGMGRYRLSCVPATNTGDRYRGEVMAGFQARRVTVIEPHQARPSRAPREARPEAPGQRRGRVLPELHGQGSRSR